MIRRYVDGPFGQVHLAETTGPGRGQRGPTCLLLHQTPRSWDEFREVMLLLERAHRLIAIDLPGMGASDPPPRPARIEHYAAAVAAVIDHDDLDGVVVCGHHTGGVVAVDLAATVPDKVKRLVLSSTPWVDADARRSRAARDPIDTVTRQRDGGHLSSLWHQRSPYYPDDPTLLDRFVADALRSGDPSIGHRAVSAYEMERAAPAVRCPVTLIEHSGDPFAAAHTDELAARFGAERVERLSDGSVPLEASADRFAKLLDNILIGCID